MKNWKDIFMMVLAVVIVLCVLLTTILLMKWQVPGENKDALYLVLGALLGSFTMVVSYFFGSSKGSSDKTELLKQKDV
jgi:uncharacterized membrane protein